MLFHMDLNTPMPWLKRYKHKYGDGGEVDGDAADAEHSEISEEDRESSS